MPNIFFINSLLAIQTKKTYRKIPPTIQLLKGGKPKKMIRGTLIRLFGRKVFITPNFNSGVNRFFKKEIGPYH